MNLTSNQLINLPVQTQSGQHLGKILDFEIDAESHLIVKYYVKTGLIGGLWRDSLIINKNQVISVDSKKMIVEDNVIVEKETVKKMGLVTPTTR